MRTRRNLTAAFALLLSTGLAAPPVFPGGSNARASRRGPVMAAGQASQATAPQGGVSAEAAETAYAKLPLEFEANHGQTDTGVDFITRAGGATVFLKPTEAVFALPVWGEGGTGRRTPLRAAGDEDAPRPRGAHALRMKLDGASGGARAEGLDRLPGVVNYFIGDDPEKWHANIPTYARVRYGGVYEGVDLVYYGAEGRRLEYDFVVAPGADPAQVALSFEGADALSVDAETGDLLVETPAGTLRQRRPFVYQEAGSGRLEVEAGYELKGAGRVGFSVGAYDTRRPLVIDPVLVYSTYHGGGGGSARAVAVDPAGNAYIAGETLTGKFPTVNPIQQAGGGGADAFVAKFNAAGAALVYSTYLGGSNFDSALAVAADSAGNACVTGRTTSTNFSTANALQGGKLERPTPSWRS